MSATIVGQRHWQPPDQLSIKKKAGWAYRYFRKADVERRLAEGWEVCRQEEKILKETGRTDSTQNYRGLILMMIPQHMADERNNHYKNLHNRRIRASGKGLGMTARAQDVNQESNKSNLTGTIGKGLELKEGVVTEEGLHHSKTTIIEVDNKIDPEEAALEQADLKETRDAQRKSDEEAEARAKESEEVQLEPELSKGSKKLSRKKR